VHATGSTWIGVVVQVDGAESGVVILIIDGDRVQLVREGQKKRAAWEHRKMMDRKEKGTWGKVGGGKKRRGGVRGYLETRKRQRV